MITKNGKLYAQDCRGEYIYKGEEDSTPIYLYVPKSKRGIFQSENNVWHFSPSCEKDVLAEIRKEYASGELFGDNGILHDAGTRFVRAIYMYSDDETKEPIKGAILRLDTFWDFYCYIDTQMGNVVCGGCIEDDIPQEICTAINAHLNEILEKTEKIHYDYSYGTEWYTGI